jgi:hypothetical protein
MGWVDNTAAMVVKTSTRARVRGEWTGRSRPFESGGSGGLRMDEDEVNKVEFREGMGSEPPLI